MDNKNYRTLKAMCKSDNFTQEQKDLARMLVEGYWDEEIGTYKNSTLDENQVQEVLEGFYSGLTNEQIQIYAKDRLTSSEMKAIREGAILGMDIQELTKCAHIFSEELLLAVLHYSLAQMSFEENKLKKGLNSKSFITTMNFMADKIYGIAEEMTNKIKTEIQSEIETSVNYSNNLINKHAKKTMLKDTEYQIKEATLLSVGEYKKYHHLIPESRDCWWLRPSGFSQSFVARVHDFGIVYESGLYVITDATAVRPALRIQTSNPESFKAGDKIDIQDKKWTVLDVSEDHLYILCDSSVGVHRFDKESNNWETSELKCWLEEQFSIKKTVSIDTLIDNATKEQHHEPTKYSHTKNIGGFKYEI